jgi:hypothetical protein
MVITPACLSKLASEMCIAQNAIALLDTFLRATEREEIPPSDEGDRESMLWRLADNRDRGGGVLWQLEWYRVMQSVSTDPDQMAL